MGTEIIKFIRQKDFKFIKEIGQGGFGKTVLLFDEIIDTCFVCKKYSPYYPEQKEQFFKNFVQEIKILHLLYHPNVVRVFNYYLYPEYFTGYILMEYIEGENIDEYISKFPESINDVFLQVIEGFKYLESENILHRDIRPQNVLIDTSNQTKIIDFGFGKKISFSKDANKSIELNWWCTPPKEFSVSKYDHTTELYFIGRLFEKLIVDNNITMFAYKDILNRMIKIDPRTRIRSFNEVYRSVLDKGYISINFSDDEKDVYRQFADFLFICIDKIERKAQYNNDLNSIIDKLELLYKRNMLEEFVQDYSNIPGFFIKGAYYYNKRKYMNVNLLKMFMNLLKSSPKEKQNIIINNLQNRLDQIKRYSDEPVAIPEDDIPF